MDVLGRSQLNSIVQSYIGKRIMIVVPSQSIGQDIDVDARASHLSLNRQIICRSDINNKAVVGLPYSYTTGRNWCRHHIHGFVGDEAFGMELICWCLDSLEDLKEVAAWYVQKYGAHHVLFISLKGDTKIWNYEDARIIGHRKLGPWQADYIELYGQMIVDDLKYKGCTYQCTSIEEDYRLVRTPYCDRSNLDDLGQLSSHLGADHILFIPALNYQVEGRTMQQYLSFLDVPYDKVNHSFETGETLVYYVLYVRHCRLKLVLDVLQLLVDDGDNKLLLYVTPEGNLYALRRSMSIQQSYGVFSRASYESVFIGMSRGGLQIHIDEEFNYDRPNMFTRMGGAMILGQLK
ncbi:MAG: hypothetical protein KH115_06810 [Veillonella sp.]|uniref:hypothetical protein n=1 Tax=Veillonella sp. TaxID=1926307 RepID=UPI001D23E204|nr:hypothetical protein [Veillonella sp.]MBS7015025.1 hypothetical protein [Veillonella sp.]